MILLTIDHMVETVIKDSRLEELKFFNDKWAWLKEKLDQLPHSNVVYEKTGSSFFVRTMSAGGIERVLTGHIVDHPKMMLKAWQYQDKTIENKQGGNTHLEGWFLAD